MKMNRSDRESAIVLILIIIAAVVLFPLMTEKEKDGNGTGREKEQKATKQQIIYDEGTGREIELFSFDPNTADSTTLLRLGLKPWQVRSIYRYRAKGGRFNKPSDFARLYGLTLKQYEQLKPYIHIEPEKMAHDYVEDDASRHNNRQQNDHHDANDMEKATPHPTSNKLRFGEKIDVNTADTTALKRIPGIGSYFARRIIEIRSQRGAFASPNDLLSIRNFPETALDYITASQDFPRIHINKATVEELHAHPLINLTQARDIIRLRSNAGAIHSAKDMSFIKSISPQHLKRLADYIDFE